MENKKYYAKSLKSLNVGCPYDEDGWSLKSKIKNMDVKVILRKLANSTKIIFWSVMS